MEKKIAHRKFDIFFLNFLQLSADIYIYIYIKQNPKEPQPSQFTNKTQHLCLTNYHNF